MSIKGFNISGTTYKVDYPELDNLPQINGNDLVGNLDAEDLGLDQVYWAGYRWATNAEIEAALDDGKIVLCRVPNPLALLDPPVVCQLTQRNSATNHRFAAITTGAEILLYVAYCINNSWTSGVFKLATDASVPDPDPNPAAPLGEASAGTSNTYSRGDHVHAMPSAEDVGAIADPDTKSNGQVLTYNGYSWVARTPSGGGGSGMTEAVKQALLDCFEHVAWIDDQGQTYYNALHDALYPPKTVVSITAVFEQGSTVVYDSASLDSLKSMLTVTARYDDNTTDILADSAYTLSGTLEAGTSTVTVTYNGKTDTFTVNVTAAPTLSSISAAYTQSGTVYDTDTLDSLKTDLAVTGHYSDSSTQTVPAADYTLYGTLTVGTSTIMVEYGGKTTTFNVTVTAWTWKYKASDGQTLTQRTDLFTVDTNNSRQTFTEEITDGYLRLFAENNGGQKLWKFASAYPQTNNNAVMEMRFKYAQVAYAAEYSNLQIQLSDGTGGAKIGASRIGDKAGSPCFTTIIGTTITRAPTFELNSWHTIRIEIKNGVQSVFIDGESVVNNQQKCTSYCVYNRVFMQAPNKASTSTSSEVFIDYIAYKNYD